MEGLLHSLKQNNQGLSTFKGLGKITINDRGSVRTARLAWAGAIPDKLRVEVLDVTGRPSMSMACDGNWVYVLSHTDLRYFKKKTSDSGLHSLLKIDMHPEELVAYLTGQLPIRQFQSITLFHNSLDDRHVMALKDGLLGIVQKIYFENETKRFEKVEMFNWGKLVYRTILDGSHMASGYQIPSRLIIDDNQGLSIDLYANKFWPNPRISPTMFFLAHPSQMTTNQ
jgi:hypothetical protein